MLPQCLIVILLAEHVKLLSSLGFVLVLRSGLIIKSSVCLGCHFDSVFFWVLLPVCLIILITLTCVVSNPRQHHS